MAEEAEAFRKTLNRHGYPFHAAVIKRVRELQETKYSWRVETSEFPVSVKGKDTRIDIVLSRQADPLRDALPAYLICECKRANPSLGHWCFCRLPFIHRRRDTETLLVEYIEKVRGERRPFFYGFRMDQIKDKAFHIGFEKRDPTGEGDPGNGRNQIEKTAGQVCTGLNGYLEHIWNKSASKDAFTALAIPVIITTARLFTCTDDLGDADLETGELPECTFTETDRVYWQYHMSPSLRRDDYFVPNVLDLPSVLDQGFARTIVVVNAAKGLDSFLTQLFAFDDRGVIK